MKKWLNSQSPRDQVALLLLTGFLLLFCVFQLALVPASEAREQMALKIGRAHVRTPVTA